MDSEFYNLAAKLLEDGHEGMIDYDIENKYVIVLILGEIYGYKYKKLAGYIQDVNIKDRQGKIPDLSMSYSTIINKKNGLEESGDLSKISDLAARIIYILYAEGADLPEGVVEEHGLENPPTIDDPQIDPELRIEAVHNWAEIFVDEILSPLTFNRTGSSYDYERYIGLCAHSALQDISPSDAANTASYLYDFSNIPSGSSLIDNISTITDENDEKHLPKELSEKLDSGDTKITDSSSGNDRLDNYLPKELVNQFVKCYQNFFELASDMGVIEGKKRIATDNTRNPTTMKGGKDSPVVAGSGSGRKSAKYGDHAWMYQFVFIADGECPFVWNPSPIYNTSELSLRLAKQLNTLDKLTDIDLDILILDREYYQSDVVEVSRGYLGDNWAIYAKKVGDVEDLLNKVQPGEPQAGNIDFASMDNPPHAVVYPNTNEPIEDLDVQITIDQIEQEDGDTVINTEDNPLYYRVSLETDVDHQTHTGYLTDIETDEQNVRKVQSAYRRREKIEPMIGQFKDQLQPYCESRDPAVRYYFAALGGLFYNMHALVTRTTSPEHVIPLNITGKEFLSGVRDVCLKQS